MVVLLLLTACQGAPGGPVVRFDLRLVPVVPYNEAPFEDSDRTELSIEASGLDPQTLDLGPMASGDTSLSQGLPELIDATLTVSAWRDDLLVAWGKAGPLSVVDGDAIEVAMLVARPGEVGWFSALPGTIYRPALAALGNGEFITMGGVSAGSGGRLTREVEEIYSLDVAPPADDTLSFAQSGTLPDWIDYNGGTHKGRSGFDLRTIAVGDDSGKLLLAGGSAVTGYDDATTVTASVFLYDPPTGEFELLRDRDSLANPRTEYLSVPNIQGAILYWGGWGATNDPNRVTNVNSLEVYDPVNRSFTDLGPISGLGQVDAAGADLGNDGSLLCGGGLDDNNNGIADWVSSDVCARIGLSGTIEAAHTMPESRIGHAMVTLPDGRVLLTGGASSELTPRNPADLASEVPSLSDAWVYNPNNDTWADGGSLGLPRSGHRMELLPDGRVLVVGGSGTYLMAGLASEPISCVEIFDPSTGRSEVLNGCEAGEDAGGLAGPAWQPSVAVDADYGILVVGGGASELEAQDAVGLYLP